MADDQKILALMVDDDPDDFLFVNLAKKKIKSALELEYLDDGVKVLSYLEKVKKFPDFVLLDINMPILDGKETLKKIKAHDDFKNIKVFILSTSAREEDKHFFKQIGAEDFFQKSCDIEGYADVLQECINRL